MEWPRTNATTSDDNGFSAWAPALQVSYYRNTLDQIENTIEETAGELPGHPLMAGSRRLGVQ